MSFAIDDPRRPAFAKQIDDLQRSLREPHPPSTARHFLYHEVIEGLYRLNDIDGMVDCCYRELDEWPALGTELRKDDPDGLLPPVIACRDRLVDALLRRGDFDAADRVAQLLVRRQLVDDPEDADLLLVDIKAQRLQERILAGLECGDFAIVDDLLADLLRLDEDSSAETLKWFGNLCLKGGADQRALEAFRAALDADPSIKGVETKLRRLARKLGTDGGSNTGRVRKHE